MKRRKAGAVNVVMITVLFGLGVLYAQKRSASGMDKSKMDTPGTVFCPGMSTGQLFPIGTVRSLKLNGAKKQSSSEALSRYNKAIDAATKRLLEDSKGSLSPEEYAQVETWFAKGLNPEINRLLADQMRTTK